jgi:hypothetical protein
MTAQVIHVREMFKFPDALKTTEIMGDSWYNSGVIQCYQHRTHPLTAARHRRARVAKFQSTKTLAERLWSKCDMSGGPDSCWLWTANKDGVGYGAIHVIDRMKKAHRISYELSVGPIPNDMHVCHRCDTPSCINPAHLFLGTRSDNMRDCEQKGRRTHGKGEQNHASKLTRDEVRFIRDHYRPRDRTYGGAALARRFGVNPSAVLAIVHRKTWREVEILDRYSDDELRAMIGSRP